LDIRKFIKPKQIIVGEEFADKQALMERMMEALMTGLPEHIVQNGFQELCWQRIQDREQRESTALGQGLFLPHARIPSFEYFGLSLAVLKNPLDCASLDGSPVTIACMMLTSEENPGIVLKVYRALAQMLRNPEARQQIEQASSPLSLFQLIQAQDLSLEITLTAADIMKAPFFEVHPEDPLPRITYNMAYYREPASAVIDSEGMMVGEITSDAVFQFGMPDFFKQLQSVSFIRNFNPLEKYFAMEAENTAGDLMSQDYAWVPPDGTLIEVIFQLSVKKRTKVYVLDHGKLVGVIGRMNVLDRAVNF
jgi:PTS system nitrogen regulatory IIA component